MKPAVLFVAYYIYTHITICSAHVLPEEAVPTVPGDNSHYVEGQSRYIWMSDGGGEPVLVDLHEPVDTALLNDAARNGANNQYWLFTRSNPNTAQVVTMNNAASLHTSNYDPTRPTKVIVHGWGGNGNSGPNPQLRAAFLAQENCNVFVLDWRSLAAAGYVTAVSGVPSVGQFLGNFLVWINAQTGASWSSMHLAGFSLGAHVVGNAGRATSGRVARITGLDPAGPLWGSINSNTMRASDGGYCEIIHTDAGGLGITAAIGHADFYPNGGTNPQPGCSNSNCSHGRGPQFFESTIYFNNLIGNQCSNVNAAMAGSCSGETLHMGNHHLNKSGNGIFHLNTGSSWPY